MQVPGREQGQDICRVGGGPSQGTMQTGTDWREPESGAEANLEGSLRGLGEGAAPPPLRHSHCWDGFLNHRDTSGSIKGGGQSLISNPSKIKQSNPPDAWETARRP